MEKREITGVQGQVNNIEVIFKEYYGSLCYFASQFLKNEEVIEDLVQDVFIALLEKKMLFQSEVHLKNFFVFIHSEFLFKLYPQYPFERSVYCFIGS